MGISCNISDGPNSLFRDQRHLIPQQLNEQLQAALVDDLLSLLGSARGDVGQRPGGLQLDVREQGKLKVGNQVREEAAI